MIKGIVFDLDGVLFNSEVYDFSLNDAFLKKVNSPIPLDNFKYLIGFDSSTDCWALFFKGYEHLIDKDEFKKELIAYKKEIKSQKDFGEIIFDDVKPFIEAMHKKGIKMACASSSAIDYVEKALKDGGIYDYMTSVISAQQLQRGKPYPDIYLLSLERMGLSAKDCVVVEDSPPGIKAGKSAGMKVIVRRDHNFGLNQSEGDYFIDSFAEIPEIIEKL